MAAHPPAHGRLPCGLDALGVRPCARRHRRPAHRRARGRGQPRRSPGGQRRAAAGGRRPARSAGPPSSCPGDLPLGWHRIVAHLDAPALDPATIESTLVVTPARLLLPPVLAEGRATGLMAQLYQVRSTQSWGIGDLGDLADLATWAAAEHGAEFVLVNPLHAAEPVAPMEPSPYLPTTRRFVNPIYLRVEDIPEVARLAPAAYPRVAGLAEAGAAAQRRRPRSTGTPPGRSSARRSRLVRAVPLDGRRRREFASSVNGRGRGWRPSPPGARSPRCTGCPGRRGPTGCTTRARRGLGVPGGTPRPVDLHRWLQWLLAGQLGEVRRSARMWACRSGSSTTLRSASIPRAPTPGGWATRSPRV